MDTQGLPPQQPPVGEEWEQLQEISRPSDITQKPTLANPPATVEKLTTEARIRAISLKTILKFFCHGKFINLMNRALGSLKAASTTKKTDEVSKRTSASQVTPAQPLPKEVLEILKSTQQIINTEYGGGVPTSMLQHLDYTPDQLSSVTSKDLNAYMQFIRKHLKKRNHEIPFAVDYSFIEHLERARKKDPTLKHVSTEILPRLLMESMDQLAACIPPVIDGEQKQKLITSIGLSTDGSLGRELSIPLDKYPSSVQKSFRKILPPGTPENNGVHFSHMNDRIVVNSAASSTMI